ncbi:hypothetical protein D1AOALGA4SA_1946 [Olavius algarvensis Delta 1 endosymbiont]|nr:hypothetical protein D1AOALGA4SA_1946 [Olavius algarvensis Delta 1 endosymbiont]
MNFLQPHPMLSPSGSPAPAQDVEMLQTDVMRFFSILCLCLMAIFALVKALPMAPAADRPTIAEPTELRREAQSLQLQIAELKNKLARIRSQVLAAFTAAEQATGRAKQAADDEKEAISRLARRQQELKVVNRALDQTRQKIKRSASKLTEIVYDIDKKQQVSSALQSEIKAETQNLNKIRTALDRANAKMNSNQTGNLEAPDARPDPEPPGAAARQGFILRFASAKALQALISIKKVKFYAVAGNKAWRLHLTGERPGYIASRNPPQIYEMEPETVPVEYMAVFKQQVAAFGRDAVTWGVTLPPRTKASIQRLVSGQKGGDLVIMPDGEVVLN